MTGPIRWGVVGGGRGGFIGPIHRMAARLDGEFVLLAGAMSSDPERARASAADCGIVPERAFVSPGDMAIREGLRDGGVEAVTIVTPNRSHAPIARMFLESGIHVICDKPLATSLRDAIALRDLAARKKRVLGVTYNYSGYPLVREARAMIGDGALGAIRAVQAEFALGWLSEAIENDGSKQAAWRTDPAQAGPSGIVADLGTHAIHLVSFVTGLKVEALAADLATFVQGRKLEDNASILLRFAGGARGMLWASAVAAGESVGLRLRVYGEKGHIAWDQAKPETMSFAPLDGEPRTIRRGAASSPAARQSSRTVAGLPEGFIEAFANLYRGYADLIRGRKTPLAELVPLAQDGVETLAFVEAALLSHQRNGAWVTPG